MPLLIGYLPFLPKFQVSAMCVKWKRAFARYVCAFTDDVAFKLEMEHESGSDSGINAPYTIWAGDSRLISADCTNYATVWTPTLQSMSNAPMDPYVRTNSIARDEQP
jgi:hypothetical protein